MAPRREEGFSVAADRFAKNVRKFRERLGWSQVQLAERLTKATGDDWPQPRVSEIESGRYNRTIRSLDAFAQVFRVDVSELLSRD